MSEERRVAEADDGIRLDRWFKRHYAGVTHALIEKSLRKGFIRVDGKKAKSADRVEKGQLIRIPRELVEVQDKTPKQTKKTSKSDFLHDIEDYILYLDTHVMALNKPSGLAVQGGTGISDSVDHMLDALQFEGLERPKLVHRLDKDTSGVLLLARSSKAAAVLAEAFASHRIKKIYWALVAGVPKPARGRIDAPLAKIMKNKDGKGSLEMMDVDEERGKEAITNYRVIDRFADTGAWLEMEPLTGRTHQLRVHSASIGHPIIGDGKYGGKEASIKGTPLPKQLHLHARRLVLPNVFGKPLDVTAPLPPHMQQSWDKLGFRVRD